MRVTLQALLTGAAALLLVGYTSVADARSPETHVLNIRLPDGQLEQVRYTGDVAPTIVLAPQSVPAEFDVFPFAMMARLTADMDQMFQGLDAPDAGFGVIPALSGPGVCMRSVQITYPGNGDAPRVVSQSAGTCGSAVGGTDRVNLPNVASPHPAPHVIQARSKHPYQGLVHMVSDPAR
jgi:hypothetical protein